MDEMTRDKFTVPVTATAEAALAAIEANGHRCVIVVGADNRVVGTLSDGDVRKALLDHRLLTVPVGDIMNLNFVSLAPGEGARARALAEHYRVSLFPVIGPDNQLLDVVTTY